MNIWDLTRLRTVPFISLLLLTLMGRTNVFGLWKHCSLSSSKQSSRVVPKRLWIGKYISSFNAGILVVLFRTLYGTYFSLCCSHALIQTRSRPSISWRRWRRRYYYHIVSQRPWVISVILSKTLLMPKKLCKCLQTADWNDSDLM